MNSPADLNFIPAAPAIPARNRVTHRTRVIFIDAAFVAELHAETVAPSQVYHAYGHWGAAPLCGTNDWRELVPDAESNCPSCRELLAR